MMKKEHKKYYIIGAILLLVFASVSAVSYNKGKSDVTINTMSAVGTTELRENYPEENPQGDVPVTSEERIDFSVTSSGRGNLSTFDIIVWTTNGKEINLGDFSFVLRQIEEIGAHDARVENYIDYIIPEHWNSSQQLTETITVKETTRKPVRAQIADEPLFKRGVDYPDDVPFAEIEIQVDLVNYYTDVEETEYVAWVRLLEHEEEWDIREVKIQGWGQNE